MDKYNFKELFGFTDRAVRNRKYAENTAFGIKAALRLFEAELSEEEAGSLAVFQDRLESIYDAVCRKNKDAFTTGSLDTYRKRVHKVLNDFTRYGTSIDAMHKWNPMRRSRSAGDRTVKSKKDSPVDTNFGKKASDGDENIVLLGHQEAVLTNKVQLVLRSDFTLTFELPVDLKRSEADRIQSVISSFALPE